MSDELCKYCKKSTKESKDSYLIIAFDNTWCSFECINKYLKSLRSSKDNWKNLFTRNSGTVEYKNEN